MTHEYRLAVRSQGSQRSSHMTPLTDSRNQIRNIPGACQAAWGWDLDNNTASSKGLSGTTTTPYKQKAATTTPTVCPIWDKARFYRTCHNAGRLAHDHACLPQPIRHAGAGLQWCWRTCDHHSGYNRQIPMDVYFDWRGGQFRLWRNTTLVTISPLTATFLLCGATIMLSLSPSMQRVGRSADIQVAYWGHNDECMRRGDARPSLPKPPTLWKSCSVDFIGSLRS